LPHREIDIVVDVLGKRLNLADAIIDNFPSEVFQWELGGLTDPVGQLIGWLWGEIQTKLTLLESGLRSAIGLVTTTLRPVIDGVKTTLSTSIAGVLSVVNSVKTSLTSLSSTITTTLSTMSSVVGSISQTLAGFGSILQTIYSTLQGIVNSIVSSITNTINTFRGWLTTAVGAISTTVSSLSSALTSLSSTVNTLFSSLSRTISGLTTSITSAISSALGSVGQTVTSAFQSVTSFLSNIGTTLAGSFSQVYSSLQGIGTTITNSIVGVATSLEKIGQSLAGVLAQINQALTGVGGQIWTGLGGLKDWIFEGFKGILVTVGQLGIQVTTFIKQIPTYFSDLWAWLEGGWNKLVKDVGSWWTDASKWWTDKISNIERLGGEVHTTLMGFINPLIDIKSYFLRYIEDVKKFGENIWNSVKSFIDPISKISKDLADTASFWLGWKVNFPKWVAQGLKDWTLGVGEGDPSAGLAKLGDFLEPLGDATASLWEGLKKASKDVWENLSKGFWAYLEGWTKSFEIMKDDMSKMLSDIIFMPFYSIPENLYDDYLNMKKGGVGASVPDPTQLSFRLGKYMMGAIGLPYIISAFMRFLGANLKGQVSAKPLGLGVHLNIDIGIILMHLAKVVYHVPDIMIGSLAYGMGIWTWQPTARLLNSQSRNKLPIELPTLEEMRRIANRVSVTDKFQPTMDVLVQFMAYYGYSDWSIGWNLGVESMESLKIDITEYGRLSTEVEDRFGYKIKIPLDLRHRIPSGSDLSRMMIHDIILKFDQFSKIMSLEGFAPDISRLYYLLHYRYPSPEMLWNFYRRGMAGMLWYKEAGIAYPEKEAGIGFDPKSPIELNYNQQVFSTIMEQYMKWHDYAPFAWMTGLPADRHMMIDLMADIPMRIDARWLYKWSVVPDGTLDGKTVKSVFNIVRARGIHPLWEEDITVAECMNALTEERSYARSGILNIFERGFATDSGTDKILENMTSIKILGKDRPVKFLEGERKLLLLRHTWDRALNVLRGLWSNLTLGFQRNMISPEEVMADVGDFTNRLKAVLKIDIEIDSTYLSAWMASLSARRDFETIQRIRYWMRVFIYRATQLAESGEKFEGLVTQFASKAMLTTAERDIMLMLGTAFIDAYKRNKALSIIQKIVKGKIKRGTMSIKESVAILEKAGMTKGEAEAYLEAEVQPRVVSIDKLISMREYIPIPEDLLKRKMDAEGVPPDEQQLYIPYGVATMIAEEVGRVATQITDDYAKGQLTEIELKKELDDLATLNGTVKTKLGVEWIVLSPEERELLISLAKKRKAQVTVTPEGEVISKHLSIDKLVSMGEDIPVDPKKLKEALERQGLPLDEQKMYAPYIVATEIKEEAGRLVTELLTDVSKRMISVASFEKELNNIATLGGQVPKLLGVEWIIYSPQERAMLVALAKLRLARATMP